MSFSDATSPLQESPRDFTRDLRLDYSIFIRAEPVRVYDAFSTPVGLDAWFTSGSSVNAIPGGEIHFRWDDWGPDHISTEDAGTVVEANQPVRFVYLWHPELPEYATTVGINLTPTEGGTIISLHKFGFARTAFGIAALAACTGGWGEGLTLLKFYLEHGSHY
jgi:uncharacterized protein YndB with AHSA1/START domain